MSNYHNSPDCQECQGKLKVCEAERDNLIKGMTGMFLQVIGIETEALSTLSTNEDFDSIGKKISEKLKNIYKQ